MSHFPTNFLRAPRTCPGLGPGPVWRGELASRVSLAISQAGGPPWKRGASSSGMSRPREPLWGPGEGTSSCERTRGHSLVTHGVSRRLTSPGTRPPECRKDASAPQSLRTPSPGFLHRYMDFLLLPGACLLERGGRSPIPVGRTISEGTWRDFPGGPLPKIPSLQCKGAGV